MKNIRLDLAFVGTGYAGWQRQKNGLAIQEVLELAIAKVTKEPAKLIGCSRTDAGVHARHFVANFNTKAEIPPDRYKPALQSLLPRDIQVLRSRQAEPHFHARRNAIGKDYRYQIYLRRTPFRNDRWWQCDWLIDLRTCLRWLRESWAFTTSPVSACGARERLTIAAKSAVPSGVRRVANSVLT